MKNRFFLPYQMVAFKRYQMAYLNTIFGHLGPSRDSSGVCWESHSIIDFPQLSFKANKFRNALELGRHFSGHMVTILVAIWSLK